MQPKFPRAVLQVLCLGALLGSFFDSFHTHSGATAYARPWVLGMAWWTPLLFGAAALGIGLTHARLDPLLRRRTRPLTPGAVAAGLAYFGGFYYLSGFLPAENLTKLALLVLGWMVLFVTLDRTWQGAALALLTALCGCLVEMLLTGVGVFAHLRADLWGIPLWLPGLYLLASLAIGNLGRLVFAVGTAPRS